MPTALEVLNLKAMSYASGYGKRESTRGTGGWSPAGGRGTLDGRSFDGGSYIDTTPAKTRLFNHNPDNLGKQMTHAAVNEGYLYEKALKLGWFAWLPGEDCRSRTFTAAHVQYDKRTGANRLVVGESVQGCKFCRVETLAEVDTPTQVQPEFDGGVSVTKQPEDADTTPFRDVAAMTTDELQTELAKRAEAEATASALTEESRAVVEAGAPMEPTESPSALPEPTPPAAITLPDGPIPDNCPVCDRAVPKVMGQKTMHPGKALSKKQISQAYRKHIESQLKQGESAHIEWYAQTDTARAVPV